jgi:hypothetical protein
MAPPGHPFPLPSRRPGYRERLGALAALIITGGVNGAYCAARHSREYWGLKPCRAATTGRPVIARPLDCKESPI